MRTTTIRRIATGLVVALASTIGLVALGAPAQAAGSPPVTKPDRVRVFVDSGSTNVDVLANDSDPDGDELSVCRVVPPKRHRQLQAEVVNGDLLISASGRARGRYTVVYYACDYFSLTRGTVTVTVAKAPKVRVQVRKIAHRPGKLRVTNKGNRRIDFLWGALSKDDIEFDGYLSIGRKRSRVVTVQRTAVFWAAGYSDVPAIGTLGETRNIKLRPKTKVLPPSIPLSEVGLLGVSSRTSDRSKIFTNRISKALVN